MVCDNVADGRDINASAMSIDESSLFMELSEFFIKRQR